MTVCQLFLRKHFYECLSILAAKADGHFMSLVALVIYKVICNFADKVRNSFFIGMMNNE